MVNRPRSRKYLSAARLYLFTSAMQTLADTILFTVMTVYFVKSVGLNPLQLVLVGTVLEGTILLFEVPTGVVADTFSRRFSIILGTFIVGCSFFLYGFIPAFWAVIAGQIIWGIGYTFTSGATQAWLADEVGAENVGRIYIQSGQVNRIVGLIATAISVMIASISLHLPLLVGGGLYLFIGLVMLLWMPETQFLPQPRENTLSGHFRGLEQTFRFGLQAIRSSPVLLTLAIVEIFHGAASEGYDRLADAHLLQNFSFPALGSFQPVVWFGVINIFGGISSFIVTAFLRPRLEQTAASAQRSARALMTLNGLSIALVIGFAVSGNFYLAALCMVLRGILGGLIGPLFETWLVNNIEPRARATVISMVGQANAFGQIAGGPGVGAIGKAFSIRSAILATSVLSTPILYLYQRFSRQPPAPALLNSEVVSLDESKA